MPGSAVNGEGGNQDWLAPASIAGSEQSTEGGQEAEAVQAPVTVGAVGSLGVVEESAAAKSPSPKPKVVPHLTRAEHVARGKAARAEVPRSSQDEIEFSKSRDPIGLLEEQAVSRVPELVPIRYGRMLVSPFAFYRGGALIMASDLSRTPNSGLRVQLCGDAHLSNFGVFGSPERNLVFDINDFDETAPGPWEWDVKRLAASFAIAGRENGFSETERRTVVLDTVRSYREALTAFARMRNLDVWYSQLPVEQAFREFTAGVDPKRLKKAEANIEKSRTKDSMQAFAKLTHLVDGEPRIISDPPLIVPIDELMPDEVNQAALKDELRELIRGYRRTLETDRRHLLEATSDIFLGWRHITSGLDGQERDFYVRQLKDWKGSFAFEGALPAGAAAYGKVCGRTLARAHARSGDRIAIASYLGKSDVFDQAIAAFAETYADQNERDYNALSQAVESGRITAQTGL